MGQAKEKVDLLNYIASIGDYEDSLLNDLQSGEFDLAEFQHYMEVVYELSRMELSTEERHRSALCIWETNFNIMKSLVSHFDPEDYFSIKNFGQKERYQLEQILLYSANRFSNHKPINLEDLQIGNWTE